MIKLKAALASNEFYGDKLMVQPVILEKLEALPEPLQTEVLHYIEFLLEKYAKQKPQVNVEEASTHYGYGSMAGQIIMSDDFDEPLEELAEYM